MATLVRVAFLCAALVATTAAAETATGHSSSKVLTGKICAKPDSACVKCVKSSSGSGSKKKGHSLDCLACSTGPVDAELDGVCVCPAGSALTGSKLTVKAITGTNSGSGKKSSSSFAHSKGPATCSECDVNSYAPLSKPVSASRCTKCPTGTTTRGQTGSATCYVEPGQFFDPSKPDGQQVITCPVDQYCPGGDIFAEGLTHPNCPAGSGTQGTTGNDAIEDCIVPSGSYYNGKDVVKCPVGPYCLGGPVNGAGNKLTQCPAGSATQSTGSSAINQCIVPAGSYYDGKNVVTCPVGPYCLGGPISGAGDVTTKCPAGSATQSTGSSTISQCLVPPSSYYDGSNVFLCTTGNYCTGGPVDGAGKNQTPCPGDQTSNPGASSVGECFSNLCGGSPCPAGSTCVPYGATQSPTCVCTATQIPAFTPQTGTCGTNYRLGTSQSTVYSVTPGASHTITYDSRQIPDRYVVVDAEPCGTVLLDTGFTGDKDYGCTESAPCCVGGAGCTGTDGQACPAFPGAVPVPGGGTGAGTTASFTPMTSTVYVVSFGVCTDTAYDFTFNC